MSTMIVTPEITTLVSERDLAPLPEVARRCLQGAGVIGRPRHTSFRLESSGWFRMRPGGRQVACRVWQYVSRPEIARVFVMTMRFGGLLPLIARDTYAHGHGRMRGRLLDRFTVVDARGPELDAGELVTWLNDALMFAPSMLLGPGITWSAVDGRAFDVAITDGGCTVSARVTVDDRWAPIDFSTEDRHRYEGHGPAAHWVRERWSTPMGGWRVLNGRRIPSFGRAIWHTRHGDFMYAELRPHAETLACNVAPPD
ncbi:MAG TPA: DUF6544 family protein [Candidatus Eisenbacteria bacterium]|nr:DUF6544 family protein [Candidatus Eisenbacteria bacterium]